MSDRTEIERLLQSFYGDRLRGDLDALCRRFSGDAKFQIAGASRHAGAITVRAVGPAEIRSWLSLLIKTYQLDDLAIASMIVDGAAAAVHWRATIFSRVTGASVPTELVDIITVRDGFFSSYTEFFVPI